MTLAPQMPFARDHINSTLLGVLGLGDTHGVTAISLNANTAAMPELMVQRLVLDAGQMRREWQGYRLQAVPIEPHPVSYMQPPVFDLDRACRAALRRVNTCINKLAADAQAHVSVDFRLTRSAMWHRLDTTHPRRRPQDD